MAVVVIGESLNATIPAICEAVKNHDKAWIQKVALEQVENDADYLDLNAQVTGCDEMIDLPWMVECVREVTNVPLVLDSSNPPAIIKTLESFDGKDRCRFISSITNEVTVRKKLLPVAAKYNNRYCCLVNG